LSITSLQLFLAPAGKSVANAGKNYGNFTTPTPAVHPQIYIHRGRQQPVELASQEPGLSTTPRQEALQMTKKMPSVEPTCTERQKKEFFQFSR